MLRLRLLPTGRARLVAVSALLVLAACSSGAAGSTGSFAPQPDFLGNNDPNPQLPNPGIPAPSLSASDPGGTVPTSPPSSGSALAQGDPNVVATKLDEPTGLVVLPDGTALVGERKSGRIYRVQPGNTGQPPVLVQTLAGVDGSGDGGLLDLAISPSYAEDGLIYAYLTTKTDNRVVHFALGSAPSTVIGGIPRGTTGNSGRIAFDATGALLTGTGNAGNPTLAGSATSLAGKILRTDDIGKPAADNPNPASAIYATGFSTVDGLCVDARTGTRFAVMGDKIELLKPGVDYGSAQPAATLPAKLTGGGGCAIASGQLLVATSTARSLAVATVSAANAVGQFQVAVGDTYGRLRTVVIGSDNAIWLTTRNRDGRGKPVADDDRVIRLTSVDGAGSPL